MQETFSSVLHSAIWQKMKESSRDSHSAKSTVKNVSREGKNEFPLYARGGRLQRLVGDFVGERLFFGLLKVDGAFIHCIDPLASCAAGVRAGRGQIRLTGSEFCRPETPEQGIRLVAAGDLNAPPWAAAKRYRVR